MRAAGAAIDLLHLDGFVALLLAAEKVGGSR